MLKFTRSCLALALLGPALPAISQPKPASHQITMTVQATTSKGEPVRGLTAAEFRLLDNKAARPITAVKELTTKQEVASLFIVVDTANMDYMRLSNAREQIKKFLTANGGKLPYPTTLVILTDKGAVSQQGFSTDGNEVLAALNGFDFGLRDIRRSSGYWGADERMQISLDALHLMVSHAGTLPGRKLFLWVSPGWPLLSGPGVQLTDHEQRNIFQNVWQLSTEMRTADVTMYNINPYGPGEDLADANYYQNFTPGVRQSSEVYPADVSLQVLAVQTGGRVFTSNSDVAGNLALSASDADNWYEVTFDGAVGEKPHEYHHIQISVDKSGVNIRTRDGYYTP
jgi:VWFA-related protein